MSTRRAPFLAMVAATLLAGCGSQQGKEASTDLALPGGPSAIAYLPPGLKWEVVANNGTQIPGTGKTFSSYNQPSVNGSGLVVFRARSTGSEGGGEGETVAIVTAAAGDSGGTPTDTGPVKGVFTRQMANGKVSTGDVTLVFRNGKEQGAGTAFNTVPTPNDLGSKFTEFPSIPRIGLTGSTIATRGQSQPVWEYWTDFDQASNSPVTTRVGTSGVYANPGGVPTTGASLLGAVADWRTGFQVEFPQYSVPGAPAGTRFDQFPGAPGVAADNVIVFKGNWTDPDTQVGKTGVYYRDVSSPTNLTVRIADSNMKMWEASNAPTFGSTAPPSAAEGKMVFVGLDNEEAPTAGGVYLADLKSARYRLLVKIGGKVPQFNGGTSTKDTFTAFGEGLSFDGRFIAFWGAWGTETVRVKLTCPVDGNTALVEACNTSPGTVGGVKYVDVPRNQGFFVYDLEEGFARMVARTGTAQGFDDFLFWNYSGAPPGKAGGSEPSLEPPRWRSNAFAAVNAPKDGNDNRAAFKALRGSCSYDDAGGRTGCATTGIYMVAGPSEKEPKALTVVDTSTPAIDLDPAVAQFSTPLFVTAMGIERDSFRSSGNEEGNSYLVVNASMADAAADNTYAGIYLARVPNKKR